MQRIILGLGSNMGDRQAMLTAAVGMLRQALGSLRISSIRETPALLPKDAPAEWNLPYLNMAVMANTSQPPEALLAITQRIEQQVGRKNRGHWGPREIDIDLLACGDVVIQTPKLTVPHAQLLKRDFALLPLAELVPDWPYPVPGEFYGRTAHELAERLFAPAPA